jgi:hypothetical protein
MAPETFDHLPDEVTTVVTVGAEEAQYFDKNAAAQEPLFSPVIDFQGGLSIPRKGTDLWAGLRRILVVQNISEPRPVA